MKYIILDRDGVINYDSDAYIKTPEEWIAIPGSLEAIAELNRAGYKVIVASNQSGIARGLYDLAMLEKIHEKLFFELKKVGGSIEEIFFCPHHPEDHCLCRKPNPGLLFDIAKKYLLNLSETFFIGDNFTDVQTADAAGCKPILLLTGKGKKCLEQHPELARVPTFENLAKAVEYLVRNNT